MEESRKEHIENERPGKAAAGNNMTTGSGLGDAERITPDAIISTSKNPEHKGSQYLVDKYNINDQAYSDSSLEDFIKTTSAFRHADDINPDTNSNENPGGISIAD